MQMAKKADAWKEYREAAMVDMMLEVMPKVAAEVAAPLTKANKITMVADSNGELGASKLTAEASSELILLFVSVVMNQDGQVEGKWIKHEVHNSNVCPFSGDDNHREGAAARQEHDRRRHRQERRRRRKLIVHRQQRLPPDGRSVNQDSNTGILLWKIKIDIKNFDLIHQEF